MKKSQVLTASVRNFVDTWIFFFRRIFGFWNVWKNLLQYEFEFENETEKKERLDKNPVKTKLLPFTHVKQRQITHWIWHWVDLFFPYSHIKQVFWLFLF